MPHKYTEEQIEWLRVNYPIYTLKQLHPLFNEHFNLNITIKSLMGAIHWRNIKSGRTGQFEKGQVPFNKGKPQVEWMSPEGIEITSKNRFSSTDRSIGNANYNERPIGTETYIKDFYVAVKVSKNKWKLKHHIIWEQHHGPVPKGMNVIFADGDKYNFDIDNLILVSDAELAVMNKNKLYFKGNGDATKVGHTIAKINLRINEVENGRKEHVK